jgi:hypothetical protein
MKKHSAKTAQQQQFVNIASRVSYFFPELDLRFNFTPESKTIRYIAPELSEEPFHASLLTTNAETIINEAILNIKELAQMFDA